MLMSLDLFCELLPTRNHILVAGLCCIACIALLLYLFCEMYYNYLMCLDRDDENYNNKYLKRSDQEEDEVSTIALDPSKVIYQTVKFSIRLKRKIKRIRERKMQLREQDSN